MLNKFKVGDRVICSSEQKVRGLVGTVFKVCSHNYDVIWKGLTTGHDGQAGDGSENHWYVCEHNLELCSKAETATTKYKVGDVVTVRDDLRYNWYKMSDGTNTMYTTDQMLTKRGKKVKIKSITKTGKYMIDGSIFPWVDEMFEDKVEKKPKIQPKTIEKYKVGDKVVIRDDLIVGKIYGGIEWLDSSMSAMCGTVQTIGYVCGSGDYRIKETGYYVSSEMISHKVEDEVKTETKTTKTTSEKSPKFKVGDKVRVRNDLETDKIYYMNDGEAGESVVSDMLKMKGKIVTIKRIDNWGKYHVEENRWNWTDEMFEPNVVTEEKREPKVGDRIKMIADYCYAEKGMTGIIKHIGRVSFAVEFDKPFTGGRSCGNYCKSDRGHWVKRDQFVVISESVPRLVCQVTFEKGSQMYSYLTEDTSITVGSEVTVPCGKGDHEATATVQRIGYYTEADAPYPLDKMKKVICKGAKPKLYNGKVVCVNSGNIPHDVTVGKIYVFVDGRCENNYGGQLTSKPVTSVDDLNSMFCTVKFIEIKE